MSENRAVRVAALLLFIAGSSFAQVENAADANAGVFGSSAIAPGSQAFVSDTAAVAWPAFNGASVAIRPVGSATPIPAQVIAANATGILFVVPPDTPLGNAQLIYSQPGQLTQSAGVSIVASHLVLYRGSVNINALGPATPNGLANPAQPDQFVEIFATGLSTLPLFPPAVSIGGVPQSVSFAGDDGAGMLQIDFQISPGTPDGCYVPLTVTWGLSTATSYLSKTSDGLACHHPLGLPAQLLKTLDSGGAVETGVIGITSALNAAAAERASRSEQASVIFSASSAVRIASYFTGSTATGCAVSGRSSLPVLINSGTFAGSPFGSTMTLRNGTTTLTLPSNGLPEYSIAIPPTADAPLNHLPAPVLGGGAWTWSSEIGSFDFTLPPPLQINGGAPIQIQTGKSQTITWNGSGFDSGATVQLSLSGGNFGPPSITCFAPARDGALTIPANLLGQFTPGGVGVLSAGVSESGEGMPHAFFTPAAMLVSSGSTDTRPVDFQ